jgi:hypothetical protein
MNTATKNIIHKLETLPKELVNEVENFIDFLQAKHSKKQIPNNNKLEEPRALYGVAKGLFIVANDFNEPLNDFKEYLN